jgi:ATP-dependent DNA ligase
MLGRLARELPRDGYRYEPKWDGFRCLAFHSEGEVELRSRNDRPLGRYFPELVEGIRALAAARVVIDGEILVATGARFDFEALLARVHPAASRVERLRVETPASLIAFDLLALGDRDLRGRPFTERRELLERTLAETGPPVVITPITEDRDLAAEWLRGFAGGGIDGVMAKPESLPYRAGERAMVKVKRELTADCVVAGARLLADRPLLSALLLGLYGEGGGLHHVGVATQFSECRRRELLEELAPLVVGLEEHPWREGFLLGGSPVGRLRGAAGRWSPEEMALDWVPLVPRLVCEVAYEHAEGARFRHPARFRRWRPDRDPLSCRLDQLDHAGAAPRELLALP